MPARDEFQNNEEELAYDDNPVGAGIMRLADHTPAQVMKFERFDDYYYQPANGFPEDKRVNFQNLDMFLVPEEATRVAALRSGEADIVPASLSTKAQVEASGGRLVFGEEGIFIFADLQGCWEPQFPCNDIRVRQALSYALDRELMRDELWGGPEVFQIKGWASVTPSTIGYTPDVDPYPFDPDQARQLLADAGYPNGEGFGTLVVNTFASTSMPFLVESAQLAGEFWRRELGIDVEVRVGDQVGVKEREDAGELLGQILWRDNETRKDATSNIASNYGDPERAIPAHKEPELFEATQSVVQILDPDERGEALEGLYARLRDESRWLGVGYINIAWGVGPRVEAWEPYPLSPQISALHTVVLK
jgi:peptide/nickel transport system substrate-binding protein